MQVENKPIRITAKEMSLTVYHPVNNKSEVAATVKNYWEKAVRLIEEKAKCTTSTYTQTAKRKNIMLSCFIKNALST